MCPLARCNDVPVCCFAPEDSDGLAGLFSYNIDSHHVQRVVGAQGVLKGFAMNEGDFELYGGPLGALDTVVVAGCAGVGGGDGGSGGGDGDTIFQDLGPIMSQVP